MEFLEAWVNMSTVTKNLVDLINDQMLAVTYFNEKLTNQKVV